MPILSGSTNSGLDRNIFPENCGKSISDVKPAKFITVMGMAYDFRAIPLANYNKNVLHARIIKFPNKEEPRSERSSQLLLQSLLSARAQSGPAIT